MGLCIGTVSWNIIGGIADPPGTECILINVVGVTVIGGMGKWGRVEACCCMPTINELGFEGIGNTGCWQSRNPHSGGLMKGSCAILMRAEG